MIKKFEPVDQYKDYADIGLKVNGDDLPQLYHNATVGMLKMVMDMSLVRERDKFKISADGKSKEEVLVNFLNAVLQQVNGNNLQFALVKITYADLSRIEAELAGEEYNRNKHLKKGTIKRVVFNEVVIKKKALEINGPLVWHTELHFAV